MLLKIMALTKENVTLNDFDKICRTCCSSNDLQNINGLLNSDLISIELILNKYTQIEVDSTDNLPKQICSDCVEKLDNAYKFLNNCNLVNKALMECSTRCVNNIIDVDKIRDPSDEIWLKNSPMRTIKEEFQETSHSNDTQYSNTKNANDLKIAPVKVENLHSFLDIKEEPHIVDEIIDLDGIDDEIEAEDCDIDDNGDLWPNGNNSFEIMYNQNHIETHQMSSSSQLSSGLPELELSTPVNSIEDVIINSDFEQSECEYSPSEIMLETSNSSDCTIYKKESTLSIDTCSLFKTNNNQNKINSTTSTDNITTKSKKRIQVAQHGKSKRIKGSNFTKISMKHFAESTIKNKPSRVKIYPAFRNTEGKRLRNKGHACYYCQIVVQNLSRHLALVHGKEKDVAKILVLPKNSKQRRDSFANLIRVGDFYHNCEVLNTKKGELILVRRPTENESKFVKLTDYGPCSNCLGFMLKKHLWHHFKMSCNFQTNDIDTRQHILAESSAILNATSETEFSTDFLINISSKIRDDDVGMYCKEDSLILKFGAMQFEKYGITQCEIVRQSMRQVARITLKLREMEDSNNSLSDYLIPEKFYLIIQATKSLCVSHQNRVIRPDYVIPSLALKIGYAIKKCAAIKRGICLRGGNISGNESITNFLNLMDSEWNIKISLNVLPIKCKTSIKVTELLSLTDDIINLSKHINFEMKNIQNSLKNSPTTQAWTQLAVLCLSKIILSNNRRSDEVSSMTTSDYSYRPARYAKYSQGFKMSLTYFELKLATQLKVVEIIGNKGRKVPLFLTEDIKTAIDTLLATRNQVNILPGNSFVFACDGNSLLSMSGHACLRQVCLDAGLSQAENLTRSKLRKYTATACQVFNLSENEYGWLARHLGHDIRVDRDYYRLRKSVIELTKVSCILISVDQTEVNIFKGKRLEEINLGDMPNLCVEYESEEQNDDEIENIENPREHDGSILPETTPFTSTQVTRKVTFKKAKINRRCPWSAGEKEAVLNFFKSFIDANSLPGKIDCEKCIECNPCLSSRFWTDIKFCIKNHLVKIHKLSK